MLPYSEDKESQEKLKSYIDSCVNCGVCFNDHPVKIGDDIICEKFERTSVPDRFVEMAIMLNECGASVSDISLALYESYKEGLKDY